MGKDLVGDIDKFDYDEMKKFEPMISRQRKDTNRSKEKLGLETIRRRRKRVSLKMYDTCDEPIKILRISLKNHNFKDLNLVKLTINRITRCN